MPRPLFDSPTLAKPAPSQPSQVIDVVARPVSSPSAAAVVLEPQPAHLPVVQHQAAPGTAVAVARPRYTRAQIVQQGAEARAAMPSISQELLSHVRASDTGSFGQDLNKLVTIAKGISPEQLGKKSIIGRVVGFVRSQKESLMAQYSSVESRMLEVSGQLDQRSAHFTKRIGDIDKLYNSNVQRHDEMERAQKKCQEMLEQLRADFEREKAKGANDSNAAMALAEHERTIREAEKHIDDLGRAILLSKQMAPKLRMLEDNLDGLVKKFVVVQTLSLPAWRDNFSTYVIQLEAREATQFLDAVDQATNAAIRTGADMLRQGTAEIVAARNRPIVTIETLKHANDQLLATIKETREADEAARRQREADAPAMKALERQLIEEFAPGQR